MKRLTAICVVLMLLVCSAFAESIDLSSYLGADINDFAKAVDGVEVTVNENSTFAANDDFSVYASIDDDEGGTGLVDYISLEAVDMGYDLFGFTIGMAQADAEALATGNGLQYEADEDDPSTVQYYNDDLSVFVVAVYTNGVISELSCL